MENIPGQANSTCSLSLDSLGVVLVLVLGIVLSLPASSFGLKVQGLKDRACHPVAARMVVGWEAFPESEVNLP